MTKNNLLLQHPKLAWIALCLLLLLAAGCASADRDGQTPAGVDDSWPSAAPETQGMDPALLEQMRAAVAGQRLNLYSLLVIRHGQIVSETYYPPTQPSTRREIYSVTKSFLSTLAGIAVDQGLLDLERPALDYMPERTFQNMDDDKAAITVRDLLTMQSGLGWVEHDPVIQRLYRSDDWVGFVLDEPMQSAPGEVYNYCSGCSHVLGAVLQEAVGEDLAAFAERELFAPLGITGYQWERDSDGLPIGGWGLQLTPREMAKLGGLYLNQGQWEGRQVVSAQWVAEATSHHVDQDAKVAFGLHWWVYDRAGAYVALGRSGQTVFVSPELDLIVVTTASVPNHDAIFSLIDTYVLPAVEGYEEPVE